MAVLIGVVGIDFEAACVEIRSLFTFSAGRKIDFASELTGAAYVELVILSTCNRSEVYYAAERDMGEEIKRRLTEFFGAGEHAELFYSLSGEDAVRHLLRVASGLESAVVGEDQILGQVGDALEFASAAGTAGKTLTRAFQTAQATAKRVKSETGISSLPLSAGYIGIKKLSALMGGLKGKSFMLIGAGEMNLLSVKYLAYEGAGRIMLCTRGGSEGPPLPGGVCVDWIPFSERYEHMGEADAVISGTSSPHTVLEGALLPPREKPLFIIDLAVPPDVDVAAYLMEKVIVLNIDDLKSEALENLEKRRELSLKAQEAVEEGVSELSSWLLRSRVDPAIESLSRRCGEIAAETERYLFNKLSLSEREKKLISKMMEASLRRLVREPVLKLKALEDEGKQDEYISLVKELFDI